MGHATYRFFIVCLLLLLLASVDCFKKGEKGRSKKAKEELVAQGKIKKPLEVRVEVVSKPADCNVKSKYGDKLSLHYTGKLQDGTVFDSSRRDGREPLTFQLGAGNIIPGWNKGLVGMCVSEKRKLTIPPNFAYGETGHPPVIPPDATLYFDVELLEIS